MDQDNECSTHYFENTDWQLVTTWPGPELSDAEFEGASQDMLSSLVVDLPPIAVKVVVRSQGVDLPNHRSSRDGSAMEAKEIHHQCLTVCLEVTSEGIGVSFVNLAGSEQFRTEVDTDVSIAAFNAKVREQVPGYLKVVGPDGSDLLADSLLIDHAPTLTALIDDLAALARQYLGPWAQRDLRVIGDIPLGLEKGDEWAVILIAFRPGARPEDFASSFALEPQDLIVRIVSLNTAAHRLKNGTGWYWSQVEVSNGMGAVAPLLVAFYQDTWRAGQSSDCDLHTSECEQLVDAYGIEANGQRPSAKEIAQYIAFVAHAVGKPPACRRGCAADWYSKFVRKMIHGQKEQSVCIHGKCLVSMSDGSFKAAEEVLPGDIVRTFEDRAALVECTIHQLTHGVKTQMCQVSSECILTPEHPFRFASDVPNTWRIPGQVVSSSDVDVSTLCNFVLEAGACSVRVGEVDCITLAHELSDASVAHPVWGSSALRRLLEKLPGYPAIKINGLFDDAALTHFMHMVLQNVEHEPLATASTAQSCDQEHDFIDVW